MSHAIPHTLSLSSYIGHTNFKEKCENWFNSDAALFSLLLRSSSSWKERSQRRRRMMLPKAAFSLFKDDVRVLQLLRCFQRRTYVSSLHLCFLAARRYSRDAVKRCLAAYLGPNAKSAAGAHAQVGQRDPPGRGQVKHFGKSWSAAAIAADDLAQISYMRRRTDGPRLNTHVERSDAGPCTA